jgi:phosphate-selective porin OprO/OprP
MKSKSTPILVASALVICEAAHGASILPAGSTTPAVPGAKEGMAGTSRASATDGPAERVKSLLALYQNEENPYVKSVNLMAQLQLQYAHGSASTGNFGTSDWPDDLQWGSLENRRFRLGLRAKFGGGFSLFNLVDLNPDFSDGVYKRTPELFLTWTHSDAFAVSAGKTELKFDREQEFTSSQFPAFERTAVGNMLYGGELTGIWASGRNLGSGWLYSVGVYSNDRQDEWSRFGDAGAVTVTKIGYDYTANTTLDAADVRLEWLHNTKPGFNNSSSNPPSPLYSNCYSLSNEIKKDRLGFTTELLLAEGADTRSDVGAISTMLRWHLTEKLEFINVLEAAKSRDDNGVILPIRYDALSPGLTSGAGDQWFSGYAGLDYYIDGHSIKLMTGVKYSHMEGISTNTGGGTYVGWTWLAGMRLFF